MALYDLSDLPELDRFRDLLAAIPLTPVRLDDLADSDRTQPLEERMHRFITIYHLLPQDALGRISKWKFVLVIRLRMGGNGDDGNHSPAGTIIPKYPVGPGGFLVDVGLKDFFSVGAPE